MKNGWVILLLVVLVACGSKNEKPNKNKAGIQKDTTQVQPGVDKGYLKKRPEEFREFFMLTDVIPFTGKVAKKKDVQSKDAVFNMDSKDPSHKALNIRLPFYAFLLQPNNKPSQFVVVLQAESLKGDTMLGYKLANGLFGICKPRELEYFESQRKTVYQTLN